jgi:4-diphosphocytidyl-2-C-methyl-D-erythritol kinase
MNRTAASSEVDAEAGRTETARAKINLALHVFGRRPDGYHQIETLVVFADFGDTIGAEPGTGGDVELTVGGPFADLLAGTPPSANLAVRAATELIASSGGKRPPPTRLLLTKRIPIAAGLGGGSADAAAALRLLNRAWEIGLDPDGLAGIGRRLGADVPMCLLSRPLVATGIGEELRAVDGMPAMPIVLAHAGGAVSTASVFARVAKADRSPLPARPRFNALPDVVAWLRETQNDLEEPAAAVSERAGAAAQALRADPECLFARMTGSGAAAFGIYATRHAASRAAERLRRKNPGWWVTEATTGASDDGGGS